MVVFRFIIVMSS